MKFSSRFLSVAALHVARAAMTLSISLLSASESMRAKNQTPSLAAG